MNTLAPTLEQIDSVDAQFSSAARLWHFDSALCSAVLSTLVDRRFLVRSGNRFSRA